jgi:maleylpyruvate isomerase
MKLYSYFRSSSSYRVRIALALKGIRYEYVPVDISPAVQAQRAVGYGEIHPLRQVPVLEWHDASGREQRLTQSVAILEYLDERWPTPPLLPHEPLERARIREAVEIVNSGIQPLQNSKTLALLRTVGGTEVEECWRREVIEQGLSALESLARANRGAFFSGDMPLLADLFIVPQLYNARRFGIDLAAFPRLLAIEVAALALDAFRLAQPERQPDAPPVEARPPSEAWPRSKS